MPKAPRRLCPRAGCPGLTDGKTCSVCGTQNKENRPSARERGYDSRWERYRKIFLAEHPLCCRCRKNGRVTEANVVHHINPVHRADDPLFWNPDNHMALCRDCHEIIHGRKKDG